MSDLRSHRARLDVLDDRLLTALGERFAVCREIADCKSAHGLAMMQPARVLEVRERYRAGAVEHGLPPDFADSLFELLIAATCRMEDELMPADPRKAP